MLAMSPCCHSLRCSTNGVVLNPRSYASSHGACASKKSQKCPIRQKIAGERTAPSRLTPHGIRLCNNCQHLQTIATSNKLQEANPTRKQSQISTPVGAIHKNVQQGHGETKCVPHATVSTLISIRMVEMYLGQHFAPLALSQK